MISYIKNIIQTARDKSKKIAIPEYTLFIIYSILIGAAAGLAAVLFHTGIEFFNKIFFEKTAEGLYFLGAAAVILIPAIGMFIQSLMIKAAPEVSKKRGVVEVIKAVALKGGHIPLKTTLFHFFAPIISIGTGNTVGPEGPAAQLGGGVASKFGNLIGLSDSRRRIFTAAGAGAAIAAIFNTPLGGVFFALEIILLNDFHTPTFSALILASVTASAISRIFLGDDSVFFFPDPQIGDYGNFYLFVLLGLFTGIISILFLKYHSFTEGLFKKKILAKIPQSFFMIPVGLFVGISGFYYDEIFGVGYHGINNVLANSLTWQVVLIILVLKLILVPLVLNSGGFGGIFAPSLFIGACSGFLFATIVNSISTLNVDPVTYTLVGMGAVLGGINAIPIAAILIIFEMTKDYSFILPLMLAVIISSTLVQIVNKGSYHHQNLIRQGFRLRAGKEQNILKSITVNQVMKSDPVCVSADTPLAVIISKTLKSEHSSIFVVDKNNSLLGIISENELRPLITEYEHIKMSVIASDILNKNVVSVKPMDDLDFVITVFAKERYDELPVLENDISGKVKGTISRQAVMGAYNKENLKHDIADGLAKELITVSQNNISKVADGFSIIERKVIPEFIGKTLPQLRLRNKYGLEALMIKKTGQLFSDEDGKEKIIIPHPDYIIEEDDTLVLFGSDDQIENSKNWL